MRKVKLLRKYKGPTGPQHDAGETIELHNNLAHALIENGVAALVFIDPKTGKEKTTTDTKKLTAEAPAGTKARTRPDNDKMLHPGRYRPHRPGHRPSATQPIKTK